MTIFDAQAIEFEQFYREWGAAVIPADFGADFCYQWRRLSHLQRAHAIDGIRQRIAKKADPQYALRPWRYLRDQEWLRPLPDGKTRLERLIAEA